MTTPRVYQHGEPGSGAKVRRGLALHRTGQAAAHAYAESFNGKPGDEWLNETLFRLVGQGSVSRRELGPASSEPLIQSLQPVSEVRVLMTSGSCAIRPFGQGHLIRAIDA